MSNNAEDAKGKEWSLRGAWRKLDTVKNDEAFKRAVGTDYPAVLHLLSVVDKQLTQFYYALDNRSPPDDPAFLPRIVAGTAPASAPNGSLLLDFEGAVGIALAVGVTLIANRNRPKPVPAAAATIEHQLNASIRELRSLLPVEMAADFMTSDVTDYRVTVGVAANRAARAAATKAADHAVEVDRYTKAMAATAVAEEDVADKLAKALGIDKALPLDGLVTAITTRIRRLMPDGTPPHCKQENTDYSRAAGRVNNALRTGDYKIARKNWPAMLDAAWKLVQCLGSTGGAPPGSGAAPGAVPAG